MTVAEIRKAVVAAVGAGVVIASTAGVAVGADVAPAVVGAFDSVVALLTAVGVFKMPNDAPVDA